MFDHLWDLVNLVTNEPQKSGPFNSGYFWQKMHFLDTFYIFSMNTCLTKKDITPFFPLALHFMSSIFCLGMHTNQNSVNQNSVSFWTRKWTACTLAFLFWPFFNGNFSYCFAAVDLLLGLLPIKNFLRMYQREEILTHGVPKSGWGKFCFSILVQISPSIDPVTPPGYHWKDLFLLQNLSTGIREAILFKGDDVKSGTKANTCHRWLQAPQTSNQSVEGVFLNKKTTDWDFVRTRIKWL